MLEIRRGKAVRHYENSFFREFAKNLKNMFDKYNLDGLLIVNSECTVDERLQIDTLLVTKHVVCIIDFKNYNVLHLNLRIALDLFSILLYSSHFSHI